MEFSKFVAFNSHSNNKYLYPTGPDSTIKFDAKVAASKGVRHEIVKAKSDSGLVHIRCCDTGKYWSCGGKQNNIIVAQANEPQEDTTKENCTLIKPSLSTKECDTVVNLQCRYGGSWQSICGFNGYLVAGGTAEDFIISDWEKLTAKQPKQPQGSVLIGNTTIGHGVLIGDTKRRGRLSIGNTKIGGNVSVNNKNTGVVSIANTTVGHGVRVRGSSSIGETTIEGDISVGNPSPNEE
jgi:hypothetical protein